jgi:hypothetical protein
MAVASDLDKILKAVAVDVRMRGGGQNSAMHPFVISEVSSTIRQRHISVAIVELEQIGAATVEIADLIARGGAAAR